MIERGLSLSSRLHTGDPKFSSMTVRASAEMIDDDNTPDERSAVLTFVQKDPSTGVRTGAVEIEVVGAGRIKELAAALAAQVGMDLVDKVVFQKLKDIDTFHAIRRGDFTVEKFAPGESSCGDGKDATDAAAAAAEKKSKLERILESCAPVSSYWELHADELSEIRSMVGQHSIAEFQTNAEAMKKKARPVHFSVGMCIMSQIRDALANQLVMLNNEK